MFMLSLALNFCNQLRKYSQSHLSFNSLRQICPCFISISILSGRCYNVVGSLFKYGTESSSFQFLWYSVLNLSIVLHQFILLFLYVIHSNHSDTKFFCEKFHTYSAVQFLQQFTFCITDQYIFIFFHCDTDYLQTFWG